MLYIRIAMAGCALLPEKLGATVQEYLRQRESGALCGLWTVSLQVAHLLRAAALASKDAADIVNKTREALLEHDTAELTIRALSERVSEASAGDASGRAAALRSLVEEVQVAEDELAEQLSEMVGGVTVAAGGVRELDAVLATAGALAATRDGSAELRVLTASATHANAAREALDAKGGGAKRSVGDLSSVTRALQGAGRCVLLARSMHGVNGAACAPGSRVLARAAHRAGVPVVVAIARHLILRGEVGCGARRRRAHPGTVCSYDELNGHRGVEVIARDFDWVPLREIEVVVTEFGGYAPRFLLRGNSI